MDEKTSVLVCLGAATAANCVPCFEHYLKKAKGLGLCSEEILEAADLASPKSSEFMNILSPRSLAHLPS